MHTLGENHPDALYALHGLATVYSGLGRYEEAENLFISAIRIEQQVLGEGHPFTLRTRAALAGTYVEQSRFAEAEEQLLLAVRSLHVEQAGRRVALIVTGSGVTIDFAQRLVDLYEAWGKPDKATEWRHSCRRTPSQSHRACTSCSETTKPQPMTVRRQLE